MRETTPKERCCKYCAWFYEEEFDGMGWCAKHSNQADEYPVHRDNIWCPKYIHRDDMRHHVAVLMLHNRWRRSPIVPAIYRMQNGEDIGKAIDFAIDYIKTFMKR